MSLESRLPLGEYDLRHSGSRDRGIHTAGYLFILSRWALELHLEVYQEFSFEESPNLDLFLNIANQWLHLVTVTS